MSSLSGKYLLGIMIWSSSWSRLNGPGVADARIPDRRRVPMERFEHYGTLVLGDGLGEPGAAKERVHGTFDSAGNGAWPEAHRSTPPPLVRELPGEARY